MSIHQTGTVHPCCRTHPSFTYGSLKDQSVKDIWNSDKTREMRRSLLRGEAQPHCRECYETEKLGERSYRQTSNERYSTYFNRIDSMQTDGTLREADPFIVDFRFSNLCNLRCRICEPLSSTAWYAESSLVHGAPAPVGTIQLPLTESKLDLFFEDLIPKLKAAHILGGEPLLQPVHYDFLEKLIEAGRTDVILTYNTNLTRLGLKNRSALKLWGNFKHVHLELSLDGVGKQLELMRKGCRWKDLIKNFRLIRVFAPNVRLRVYPAVSVMNCFHLTTAVQEWIELKMIWDQEDPLKFNFVDWPLHYSVGILNAEECQKLADHYERFFSDIRPKVSEQLFRTIQGEFRRVLARAGLIQDKKKLRRDFRRITLTLDQSRSESLKRLFPEHQALLTES